MDNRFPQWQRTLFRKTSFLQVPNLGGLLAGVAVVAFFANQMFPVGVDQFYFDPVAIFEHGQWWRLFTFPFMASFGGPIHLIFYCLYVYFVMQTLESHWGAGPLTLFMLVSYIMTVAAGLVFHAQMDVSYYVLANISLALGTLLPNLELSLYFLIPVKAKWLAMLSGALILVKFVGASSMAARGFMLMNFSPYLFFFGPMGIAMLREQWRLKQHRKKFDNSMWR